VNAVMNLQVLAPRSYLIRYDLWCNLSPVLLIGGMQYDIRLPTIESCAYGVVLITVESCHDFM
jgi:hypothetical protein